MFRQKPKGRHTPVAAARKEREQSERALADAEQNVIKPLRELRERNHFAELIARHIVAGYHQWPQGER